MTGETVQQACTFNLTCPLWQILHSPTVYVTMVATHLIQFNFKYLKTGFLIDGCTLKMTVCVLVVWMDIFIVGSATAGLGMSHVERDLLLTVLSDVNQMHMILSSEICTHARTHTAIQVSGSSFFSLLCLQLLVIPLIPDRPRPGGFDSSDARCPNP